MTVAARRAQRARLLLTGDELLRGFIQDANSGFLAARLREIGIELDEIRVVGDDFEVIERALAEALGQDGIDLVLVTGGLGPTHDDRTSQAVARAIGVELELQADALQVVEDRIRAYGRMRTPEEIAAFAPGNRKQAMMPAGSTWVDPLGTAPGYVVATGETQVVVVLPGPPSELRHAWQHVIDTQQFAAIRARVVQRHERVVRLWGIPESRGSQVLDALGHVDEDARRVTICARDGELEISVRGSDQVAIDELVDGLGAEFGPAMYAIDDHRGIVEMIGDELRRVGWTLGLAESCTGGMLGQLATSTAGSSDWFTGSLVTYSNAAKTRVAQVDASTIFSHGAVSEAVAIELAQGARAVLGTDVGIGITGVAGPGGGSKDKPVGTVHVAIVTPTGTRHRQLHVPGNRETVRRRSCIIVLQELRQELIVTAS